jgi:hypothetical protein
MQKAHLMRSRSLDDDLVSGLALFVIAGGTVAGLHWLGFDTGVPRWLACSIGHPIINSLGPGLSQLLMVLGVFLAIFPWTRPTGVGLIFGGIGGMVAVQVWTDTAGGYCGFTGAVGFTP